MVGRATNDRSVQQQERHPWSWEAPRSFEELIPRDASRGKSLRFSGPYRLFAACRLGDKPPCDGQLLVPVTPILPLDPVGQAVSKSFSRSKADMQYPFRSLSLHPSMHTAVEPSTAQSESWAQE
jgi:hypothetical protein